MWRLLLVLALSTIAVHPAPAADPKAEEAEIRSLIGQWLDAVAAKDAAATAGFYAEDGLLMPQGEPLAEGATAISAAWATMFRLKDFNLTFMPESITVAEAGDMAYDIGTYELSYASDSGKVIDRGKYVVVWRKVDGAWKVAADIFNSDSSP